MGKFNWLDFCIPCNSGCCHNENPFASDIELKKLNVKKINQKEDGSCIFQNKSGNCTVYEERPFECRIFPLDIMEINNKLYWVIWDICSATEGINYNNILENIETNFPKKWSLKYIQDYTEYHKLNQPIKYSKATFKIIKELKWPGDNNGK